MCRFENDLKRISIVTATSTSSSDSSSINKNGANAVTGSEKHCGNDVSDGHIKVQVNLWLDDFIVTVWARDKLQL